jgi:type I restriction enzyme R subunit
LTEEYYSLKEGIDDGFLTPFKVNRIQTTKDDYIYTNDDEILEGNVEIGKLYEEKAFNKNIEIKARESRRVQVFMAMIYHTLGGYGPEFLAYPPGV